MALTICKIQLEKNFFICYYANSLKNEGGEDMTVEVRNNTTKEGGRTQQNDTFREVTLARNNRRLF